MSISLIAALGYNRVIGINNNIPWKLSNDLLWFQKNTINKPIIMGRITYETLKKPLFNRKNIILSHTYQKNTNNIFWVTSLKQAIIEAGKKNEIMIIGGEKIYKLFLPYANKLYLTHVDINIYGDVFFPFYKQYKWNVIYNQEYKNNKHNSHNYRHEILERYKK